MNTTTVEKTEKKKGVAAKATSTVVKISAVIANLALLFFAAAMGRSIITPETITAQIKNEGVKMNEFGIDLGMLQALSDYFIPGNMTPTLSLDKAAVTAYQYLTYQRVVNGVNVFSWFASFVQPNLKPIFGSPTSSSHLSAIEKLVVQKCLIGAELKNQSSVTAFGVAINDLTSETVNKYPHMAKNFGIKTATLAELNEFSGRFVRDVSNLTRTAVGNAAIEQKATIAKAIGRTEKEVEAWGLWYKNTVTNFNVRKTLTVRNVSDSMEQYNFTPAVITSLSHTSRKMIAASEVNTTAKS